ncbi:MAG: N-acetylglucosamine-6-phosphate deacetylase [Rhodobacterales bacterium]|nr:N-acetylglucosamine-6-phosphate deacetylase [Rhodobacterales bacterium]
MTLLVAETLFDGARLHRDIAVRIEAGRIAGLEPAAPGTPRLPGLLAPGLIDLQVNGGAGRMVGAGTTVDDLRAICAAHARLGATGILPTLISDGPQVTERVLDAGRQAARDGVPGFLGLHLEGPHLCPARVGAHDPARLRPMTEDDCVQLIAAAADLPALMVTLSPRAVRPAQIARLAAAGVVVSLGHTDATVAEARAALAAGARCVTHLFNAMAPLGHRAPGLPGAVLTGGVAAGLIADGLHVAPEVLQIALAARPGGLFLVSDAMAVAGTDLDGFALNGRQIRRAGGRLTLTDGTLAGADLTLPQAVARLVALAGAPVERALAMASAIPAGVIGAAAGRVAPGLPADLVLLGPGLDLRAVWQGGVRLDP